MEKMVQKTSEAAELGISKKSDIMDDECSLC